MPKIEQRTPSKAEKLFNKRCTRRKWEIRAIKREIKKLRPLLQDAQPDCFMKKHFTDEQIGLWQLPTRREVYSSQRMERFTDRNCVLRSKTLKATPWVPLPFAFEINLTHPHDLKLWRKDLKALRKRLRSS